MAASAVLENTVVAAKAAAEKRPMVASKGNRIARKGQGRAAQRINGSERVDRTEKGSLKVQRVSRVELRK
jgi:hypothetical protein